MISQIKVYMQIEIRDKNGKLVRRTHKKISYSFVKAFVQHLELLMAHPYGVTSDNVSIVDTGGTTRSIGPISGSAYNFLACESPVGNTNYGILAGTGTNAPANTDYALQTLIAHGNGANQLQYQATSMSVAGVVGANVDVTITRSLINNSGGTITIREVGLAVQTGLYYYLLIRDLANQDVANAQTATITYTIRTTV